MSGGPSLAPLSQGLPTAVASGRKPRWLLPFFVLAGLYLTLSAYIAVVDYDFTAILVGILIVLILYIVFRYVARLAVVR
jgi:hypothetical protein